MAQGEGRAAGGRYTWVWMIVAVLMVGGFMAWLAMTSETTTVVVVEEDEGTGSAAGAASITTDDLMTNAAGLRGQDVLLAGVQVAGRMGSQAFWIQLPNQSPYLIKLGPELVADGLTVQSGEVLDVVGRVQVMTDSVLAAWEEQGAIADAGQRAEAEFAQDFVEARVVLRSRSEAPQE